MSTEKKLRKKLAIAHHTLNYYGWDDLVSTHISIRLEDDSVLITPHNVSFDRVNKNNIVRVDLDGNILSDNGYKVMPQAANIHLETYKARADINAIIHTHSMYGVILSTLESGMIFNNKQVLRFYNDIAYHDYGSLALDNEGEEIAKSLGANKNMMILHNHGLITTANSIELALYKHYYFEKCAETQVKALSTNQKLIEIPQEVCEKTAKQFSKSMNYKEALDVFINQTKKYRS